MDSTDTSEIVIVKVDTLYHTIVINDTIRTVVQDTIYNPISKTAEAAIYQSIIRSQYWEFGAFITLLLGILGVLAYFQIKGSKEYLYEKVKEIFKEKEEEYQDSLNKLRKKNKKLLDKELTKLENKFDMQAGEMEAKIAKSFAGRLLTEYINSNDIRKLIFAVDWSKSVVEGYSISENHSLVRRYTGALISILKKRVLEAGLSKQFVEKFEEVSEKKFSVLKEFAEADHFQDKDQKDLQKVLKDIEDEYSLSVIEKGLEGTSSES
jgi:hypothetical protein